MKNFDENRNDWHLCHELVPQLIDQIRNIVDFGFGLRLVTRKSAIHMISFNLIKKTLRNVFLNILL
jgi:hypothetical protein